MLQLENLGFRKALLPTILTGLLSGCMGESQTHSPADDAFHDDGDTVSEPMPTDNAAPYFISTNGWDVYETAENTHAFYTALALDDDGDTVRFGLSPDSPDAALFAIDTTTGQLGFVQAPDYETPLDEDKDNRYDITLTASDGNGGISEFDLRVWVHDERHEGAVTNANPPFFFEGVVYLDVSYDTTGVIHTARAFDIDGDTIVYGMLDTGVDQSEYQINHLTGEIVLLSPPNRNKRGDTLWLYATNSLPIVGNHTTVEIRYYDGQPPVEPVDNPHYPVFTSPTTVEITQDPGRQPFYVAKAEDADGDSVRYAASTTFGNSIHLEVDAVSGEVSFANAYESTEPPTLSQLRQMYDSHEYFLIEADDGRGKKGFHVLKVVVSTEE